MRCHLCGRKVKGNLNESKAIKCTRCVNGEVEYVRNHPEEYPEPKPVKVRRRVKRW
jgi:hypothetical protein